MNQNFIHSHHYWFQEPIVFDESNLPIIMIDTYGAEIPDEPRIPAYMGIINNQSGINHIDDPFNDYDGHITIERKRKLFSME